MGGKYGSGIFLPASRSIGTLSASEAAELGVSAPVRSAFPCLYPYQPNIGRYWPLLMAHSLHSTPSCWLSTGPANQPQGGKGGLSPLLTVFWVGGGGFGARDEAQKGRIRAAFFARADYIRLKND